MGNKTPLASVVFQVFDVSFDPDHEEVPRETTPSATAFVQPYEGKEDLRM